MFDGSGGSGGIGVTGAAGGSAILYGNGGNGGAGDGGSRMAPAASMVHWAALAVLPAATHTTRAMRVPVYSFNSVAG